MKVLLKVFLGLMVVIAPASIRVDQLVVLEDIKVHMVIVTQGDHNFGVMSWLDQDDGGKAREVAIGTDNVAIRLHEVLHLMNLIPTEWNEGWQLALASCVLYALSTLVVRLRSRNRLPKSQANYIGPPINAEFLFYLFLEAPNCDALVGDLEERYKLILKKFGAPRATFWYWTQAIRSVGPIVWVWMRRIMMKPVIGVIGWAVARGLVGHHSWLTVLLELYRGIRS